MAVEDGFFKGIKRKVRGVGREGNLGTTFSQLAIKRMLTSGIFKQLGTFVVVS